MLVARFLDGLAGSAFLSVAGGTVGDMFAKHVSLSHFLHPSLKSDPFLALFSDARERYTGIIGTDDAIHCKSICGSGNRTSGWGLHC